MESVRVRQYVRRRLTKAKRTEGMIRSAQSPRTPKHLREGLRKHLDEQGIDWRVHKKKVGKRR